MYLHTSMAQRSSSEGDMCLPASHALESDLILCSIVGNATLTVCRNVGLIWLETHIFSSQVGDVHEIWKCLEFDVEMRERERVCAVCVCSNNVISLMKLTVNRQHCRMINTGVVSSMGFLY